MVLAAVLVVSACNPLVGQSTEGFAGNDRTTSYVLTYEGEGGWLEVRLRGAGDVDLSVQTWHPENGTSSRLCVVDGEDGEDVSTLCGPEREPDQCRFRSPARSAWVDGESLDYRRLAEAWPEDRFYVSALGSGEPVTFDVRVVDEEGNPVGAVTHHVPDDGEFASIGYEICGP